MKQFLVAILFTIVVTAYSNEIAGYFQDADYPGTCVYDELIVWPDDVGHPKNGKCERIYCLNEDGYGKILSCRPQKIPAGCKLGEIVNPDSTYPDCCERHIICA
ncbi:uncharacterized protein LOC106095700 [Stomoxys calcitrans]|uniref:uncharacterized protein LOC106095700 n=1 Tax=Stomoxys calcitrans TaxID=35570 RepID=UPI0027E38C71|nr:uncharacterized protein LOC106095700 [Stomoxys calcitrans]